MNTHVETKKRFSPSLSGILKFALLFIVLILVIGIRLRLRDLPLERDEGEYAYAAQLILQGESFYQHAYNVALKFPGTCFAYAAIMSVFGQTAAGIREGLILVNLATAILVYLVARRILDETAAAITCAAYALLSLSPAMFGLAAHATHFEMLPALAGLLLLVNRAEPAGKARLFACGSLMGIAIWMKQTGAAFAIFPVLWLIWNDGMKRKNWRGLAVQLLFYGIGAAWPMALTCVVLLVTGDFGQFWLWSIQFASQHGAIIGVRDGFKLLAAIAEKIFKASPELWTLSLAGLFLLRLVPQLRRWRFFVGCFFFLSMLAVCPGFFFRHHYFIQLVPVAAIFTGIAFQTVTILIAPRWGKTSANIAAIGLFVVIACATFVHSRGVFFSLSLAQASRAMYGLNPFPEAIEIARYIESNTQSGDRIAILGSEPQIFFYSHRHSVTGHICTYALMEPQPFAEFMQRQMISEIEQGDPEYLIYVNIPTSWTRSSQSNPLIFDWYPTYERRFQFVGLVQLFPDEPTDYWWPLPKGGFAPRSSYWIAIMRNKKLNAQQEGR